MLETSARLLRLLSLLQSRADWTGSELAERLDVGLRTVRRDIGRLRELGYPVSAAPGVAGGYRLGAGAALPPLLLDDEEAVAVAISLRTAATGSVAGLEESALRALTKLQQMLPPRLRHRVSAFQTTTVALTIPRTIPRPDRPAAPAASPPAAPAANAPATPARAAPSVAAPAADALTAPAPAPPAPAASAVAPFAILASAPPTGSPAASAAEVLAAPAPAASAVAPLSGSPVTSPTAPSADSPIGSLSASPAASPTASPIGAAAASVTGLPVVSLAGAPAGSVTGESDGGPVEPVAGSGHGVGGAVVNAGLLAAVAVACRDRRRLRLRYQGRDGTSQREVEPHRLVHTPRRWYLLAWDLGKDDWRTFRVDRIEGPLGPPGARFTPRPLPQEDHEDAAAYVARSITSAPYRYRARVLFHAPLEAVAPRTSPGAGRLEAVDGRTCRFSAGADSLDELALHVAVKGFDFEVLEPPELVPVLREVAARLRRAADRDTPADGLGNVRRPSREPRPPK